MLKESESKNSYRQYLPNGLSFDLIHVKGGSYFFGDSDPEITLPDFYIGQHPVTQALWHAVMGDNPAYFKGKNRPVEQVSWYDAAAFCNALNILTGYSPVYFRDEKFLEPLDYDKARRMLELSDDIDVFHNPHNPSYQLPSETQWEYAARGGAKKFAYKYAGSVKLEEVGWYDYNSHRESKPVGLKVPNELEIYDMSGNVEEWCADQWYDINNEFKNVLTDGAARVNRVKGSYRVYRGGGWKDYAQVCLATFRDLNDPSVRLDHLGFRVVLFPPPAPKIDL